MKFKNFTLSFFISLITLSLQAQLHIDWAYNIGGKLSDYAGYMKGDDADNLYAFAEFQDSTDLDTGPGTDWVFPKTSNAMVLYKLNGDGQFQWSARFYDGDNVFGSILEVKENRIRISLNFKDSLVYEFHGQSTTLFHAGKATCLMNLDLNGHILDTHLLMTTGYIYFANITTLDDGRTLLAGSFTDSISFVPAQWIVSKGDYDAFVAVLDKDYHLTWIKLFNTLDEDFMEGLYLEDDHIYFALNLVDSITVQTKDGTKIFPNNGKENGLFGYLSMTGSIENIYAFGGDDIDEIRAIAVDQDDFVYIDGYFGSTVNFSTPNHAPAYYTSTGSWEGFVAKYSPQGELVWVRTYPSTYYTGIYTLELKRGNELYLTGGFTNKSDLDPGPDSIIVETNNQTDIFISKLSTDGDLKWSYPFSGPGFAGPRGLHVSTENSKVYLTGYFESNIDCDPSANDHILTSHGNSDIFFVSLSEDNVVTATREETPIEIGVYPNPSTGYFQLTSDKEIKQVNVQSLDGKLIGTWKFTPSQRQEMDLHNVPPGLYFMSIQSGDQWITEKIIIQ